MYNEWEEYFVYTFELDIGGRVGHLLPANDAVCEHAYLSFPTYLELQKP